VAITADLTGRRLLVTGASSGIGEATCRALVECGTTAVADTIAFMLGLPKDVGINETVLRPTAQLSP
jgi:NADP-dependent 3-hydroxy acid dehydrogenase YdfG